MLRIGGGSEGRCHFSFLRICLCFFKYWMIFMYTCKVQIVTGILQGPTWREWGRAHLDEGSDREV